MFCDKTGVLLSTFSKTVYFRYTENFELNNATEFILSSLIGPQNCRSQLLFVVVIFDVFDEKMLTKVILLITPMVVLSDPPEAGETPPKSVGRDPLKITDTF